MHRVTEDSTTEDMTVYGGRFWLADRPGEQRPSRLLLTAAGRGWNWRSR